MTLRDELRQRLVDVLAHQVWWMRLPFTWQSAGVWETKRYVPHNNRAHHWFWNRWDQR